MEKKEISNIVISITSFSILLLYIYLENFQFVCPRYWYNQKSMNIFDYGRTEHCGRNPLATGDGIIREKSLSSGLGPLFRKQNKRIKAKVLHHNLSRSCRSYKGTMTMMFNISTHLFPHAFPFPPSAFWTGITDAYLHNLQMILLNSPTYHTTCFPHKSPSAFLNSCLQLSDATHHGGWSRTTGKC